MLIILMIGRKLVEKEPINKKRKEKKKMKKILMKKKLIGKTGLPDNQPLAKPYI